MFPLKNDFEDSNEKKEFNFSKDFSINKNKENSGNQGWNAINPQSLLPGLEKLCKIFGENQARIEGQLSTIGSGNLPVVSEFIANKPTYWYDKICWWLKEKMRSDVLYIFNVR